MGVQNLATLVVQIVTFGILARIISVDQMGVLTILTTAMAGVQVISNLGLGNVITKLVAEKVAQEDMKSCAGVCSVSFLLNLTSSAAIAVVIIILKFPAGIAGLPSSNTVTLISLLLALDVVIGYNNIFGAGILGLQKFRVISICTALYTISRQVLIIVLILLLRSIVGWMAAWVITDFIYTLITFAYWTRQVGSVTFKFSARRILTLSLPLLITNIVLFGYNYIDRLFLIGFVDLEALGVYGAAVNAFTAYLTLVGVLPIVLLPAFAKIHGAGGIDDLRSAVKTSSRYISFTALPIAFALLAAARPAITLFVGKKYEAGAFPLAELAAFSTATILAFPLSSAFIVVNETALYAVTIILPLAASIAIAFMTVSTLGIVAASTARGISMLLNLVLSIMLLRRKFPVTFDTAAVVKAFTASMAMALVVWLLQIVLYNPLLLPLYAVSGAVIYLLSLRALRAVTTEDMELLKNVTGSRFERVISLISRILLPQRQVAP